MARKARSVRFCEEEDCSGTLQDKMLDAAGMSFLLREFTLGNPKLRDLSAEQEEYRWQKKQEAYGADGSQIFDLDEVVVIGSHSWSFYFCKVDYFHGLSRTSSGRRVIAQMFEEEIEVFAYEMVSLKGYAIEMLRRFIRRWRTRRACSRLWQNKTGVQSGLWRAVRAVGMGPATGVHGATKHGTAMHGAAMHGARGLHGTPVRGTAAWPLSQ